MIYRAVLPLFILVASHSCTSGNTDERGKSLNKVALKLDTVSKSLIAVDSHYNRLTQKIAFLDSNLKYGRLGDQMAYDMKQAEADYYRTKDEKYYKLFYKLRKKQWYYAGLNRKYYDSLHSK